MDNSNNPANTANPPDTTETTNTESIIMATCIHCNTWSYNPVTCPCRIFLFEPLDPLNCFYCGAYLIHDTGPCGCDEGANIEASERFLNQWTGSMDMEEPIATSAATTSTTIGCSVGESSNKHSSSKGKCKGKQNTEEEWDGKGKGKGKANFI